MPRGGVVRGGRENVLGVDDPGDRVRVACSEFFSVSITSSRPAAESTATMSMRGVITSATVVSASEKTPRSMSRSTLPAWWVAAKQLRPKLWRRWRSCWGLMDASLYRE